MSHLTTTTRHDALAAYGWNDAVAARFAEQESGGEPVRIVRIDRSGGLLATSSGVVKCRVAPGATGAVTGDWALAGAGADGVAVVHTVLERRSVVRRIGAADTGDQILAANVDTMFLLHGIDRPHRVGRLQRLCILSWEGGVHPVVVITKTDLAGRPEAVIDVGAAHAEIDRIIHAVEVHAVSAITGSGLGALAPYLTSGRTIGLAGESGAGKSTLVNALAEVRVQATAATRRGDHKGRHTTTARRLIPIPGGGVLVDTPGLRSIAVPAAADGLSRAFADVEALFAECRFRDCAHRREPGCAVKAALGAGLFDAERWAGYEKLRREMAYQASRAIERDRRRRRSKRRPPEPRPRLPRDVEEW